jgi:hypothetical protein
MEKGSLFWKSSFVFEPVFPFFEEILRFSKKFFRFIEKFSVFRKSFSILWRNYPFFEKVFPFYGKIFSFYEKNIRLGKCEMQNVKGGLRNTESIENQHIPHSAIPHSHYALFAFF